MVNYLKLKPIFIRNNENLRLIILSVSNSFLKFIFALILIRYITSTVFISSTYILVFQKIINLLLIATISWFIIKILLHIGNPLLKRYEQSFYTDPHARKNYTQLVIIRKILVAIILFITGSSMLMVFESVRELGTSLLASAGIIGGIILFAAQHTFSTFFSGLLLAFTQPIKVGDTLIIENELGQVEEISLTYVVLRLWDWRRLVIPINYIMEKPFQNWTISSSRLIGIVYLYVDFSLPVDQLREELNRVLKETKLWDKQVGVLQVSDVTENTMQLRILVSAEDGPKAWDLRCEVREKLIAFVQKNFPSALPKNRSEVVVENSILQNVINS